MFHYKLDVRGESRQCPVDHRWFLEALIRLKDKLMATASLNQSQLTTFQTVEQYVLRCEYAGCGAGSEKNLKRVGKLRVGLGPRNPRHAMESTYFEKAQK